MITISAVRMPQFTECINALALAFPRAQEIIDGAIWEISHNPKGCGIYLEEFDVWQARLDPPPVLLYYDDDTAGRERAECKQVEDLVAAGGKFYEMDGKSWCDTATESWYLVPGKGYVKAE